MDAGPAPPAGWLHAAGEEDDSDEDADEEYLDLDNPEQPLPTDPLERLYSDTPYRRLQRKEREIRKCRKVVQAPPRSDFRPPPPQPSLPAFEHSLR